MNKLRPAPKTGRGHQRNPPPGTNSTMIWSERLSKFVDCLQKLTGVKTTTSSPSERDSLALPVGRSLRYITEAQSESTGAVMGNGPQHTLWKCSDWLQWQWNVPACTTETKGSWGGVFGKWRWPSSDNAARRTGAEQPKRKMKMSCWTMSLLHIVTNV